MDKPSGDCRHPNADPDADWGSFHLGKEHFIQGRQMDSWLYQDVNKQMMYEMGWMQEWQDQLQVVPRKSFNGGDYDGQS